MPSRNGNAPVLGRGVNIQADEAADVFYSAPSPARTPLAQRHAAALRLAPLDSGLRDPVLDRPTFGERATRDLCRELWAQGFSVEYLERRYGITANRAVAK